MTELQSRLEAWGVRGPDPKELRLMYCRLCRLRYRDYRGTDECPVCGKRAVLDLGEDDVVKGPRVWWRERQKKLKEWGAL